MLELHNDLKKKIEELGGILKDHKDSSDEVKSGLAFVFEDLDLLVDTVMSVFGKKKKK